MTIAAQHDSNAHELWYASYDHFEGILDAAIADGRVRPHVGQQALYLLADVMVSTGVAQELVDEGRLSIARYLDADDQAESASS